MFKPKKIIIPAVAGFVLSFLISIISIHKFSRSLLRATIFGIIFALLGFLIDFLDSKFLSVDENDLSFSNPQNTSEKTRGRVVDFTVDDENLTEDDKGPAFAVSLNKVSLSEKDKKILKSDSENQNLQENSSQGSANSPNSNSASFQTQSAESQKSGTSSNSAGNSSVQNSNFSSVSLGKKFETKDFSGKIIDGTNENSSNSNSSNSENLNSQNQNLKSEENSSQKSNFDEEIDSLPDFSDNVEKKFDGENDTNDDIIETSEFAQDGIYDAYENTSSSNDAAASNHDAATIANAIRTVLKREE